MGILDIIIILLIVGWLGGFAFHIGGGLIHLLGNMLYLWIFGDNVEDYLGHVNGHVEEMYGGHLVMKAFNGEEKSIRKFDGLNEELYGAAWKSQFFSGIMMPMMMFIGNLGYVIVCILGGYLVIQRTIQVGDILAFIQYVRSFTQPLAQVANMVTILQSTAAAAERVFEFLREEEEVAEAAQPAALDKVTGSVAFKNVFFGYNPAKTIINNFSASIQPGQKVAIVGPTGAGKTTMVKLLMRFYDVGSGAILVDNHDIRDFTRFDLRRMFGMVLQDTWLYNGPIMENIRYGRLEASDEEVAAAAVSSRAVMPAASELDEAGLGRVAALGEDLAEADVIEEEAAPPEEEDPNEGYQLEEEEDEPEAETEEEEPPAGPEDEF